MAGLRRFAGTPVLKWFSTLLVRYSIENGPTGYETLMDSLTFLLP